MILVDTGVLYALADKTDRHHSRCVEWLRDVRGALLVPPTVLAEAGYLVGTAGGNRAETELLSSIGPGGRFTLAELTPDDLPRMGALLERYADLRLGTTDASVVAIAERLRISSIATVDHRHFAVVRPNHVASCSLVPE